MTNIRIIIASGENRLFDCISEKNVTVEIRQLEVGDIAICAETGEAPGADGIVPTRPLLFLERKTAADMEASNKDGRYRNQRARLFASGVKFGYIIEGDKFCTSVPTMFEVYVNMVFKHGIVPIYVADVAETANVVVRIARLLAADPERFQAEAADSRRDVKAEYLGTIRTKKSDNIDTAACLVMQISQIPGISTSLAASIISRPNTTEKFGSMGQFMAFLAGFADSDARIRYFQTLEGIGKKRAESIEKYLFG